MLFCNRATLFLEHFWKFPRDTKIDHTRSQQVRKVFLWWKAHWVSLKHKFPIAAVKHTDTAFPVGETPHYKIQCFTNELEAAAACSFKYLCWDTAGMRILPAPILSPTGSTMMTFLKQSWQHEWYWLQKNPQNNSTLSLCNWQPKLRWQ